MAALVSIGGCGGGMRNARPMTDAERGEFVSRPTPLEVPEVDGLSTIGARVRIDAPPARVWQVMAVGFGELEDWAGSGIQESECTSGDGGELGATRSCRIADHVPFFGGDYFEERINGWDEAEGYFSVIQTRATGPTTLLVNENWIDGDGDGGTVVTQLVHIDFKFPASWIGPESDFKRKQVEALIGMKHFIETGERVTPKNWENVVSGYPTVLEDNEV